MKLALFDDYRPGLVVDDHIVDLSDTVGAAIMAELPRDRMGQLIENFAKLRPAIEKKASEQGKPLSAVKLRAPLPRPSKMLFGLGNYQEFLKDTPPKPLNMFVKNSRAVTDPGGTVTLIPPDPWVFHHEGELAIVIGKHARNVSMKDSMDYIFGYTCVIDVSARGFMSNVNFINKSPDTFCPMGPWISTADAVGDPQKLNVKVWVDGQLRQDYPTSDMEHPVREIVSWASHVVPLEPGDLLACGVNHQGLGPLQDGETAEIEISHIGKLSVKIADPKKRKWPVGVDKGMAGAALNYRRNLPLPPPLEMFVQQLK